MGTLIPPLNLKTTMTYQLCDAAAALGLCFECTLNASIWVQSSQSVDHSGPEEGRVHPNRSQEYDQDYRHHEPISFSSLSYLFQFAPHTQTVCVAAGELADEMRISSLLRNRAEPVTLQIWASSVAAAPSWIQCAAERAVIHESLKEAEKEANKLVSPVTVRRRDVKGCRGPTQPRRRKTNWIFVAVFQHQSLNRCDKCVMKAKSCLIQWKTKSNVICSNFLVCGR